MEKSHKPLFIGVTYMVQQHRLNFLATGRMAGICAVPGCYLNTVADPQDGITLIFRGDGYPVAGCSWTQLNVSIMDHGRHARTTSHMCVISLAHASDKDMEDLEILWKTNVEVRCAAFFVTFHRKKNFSS